ncbi:MAG: acetate kinase [Eubacteriales bacterium]|nr:acetate kinase [Eubacteriales bacterium]
MNILVLNCGSSSLKYQLINMDDEKVLAKGLCERIGINGSLLTHQKIGEEKFTIKQPMPTHNEAVKLVFDVLVDKDHGVIKSSDEIDAIGHRVLHGGTKFTESIVVDEKVKETIKECFDLGPLHNPANLMGIVACEKNVPGKKNVAVFDTTFGMGMEEKAFLYAIPYEYYEKYGIRRYGFHGTSHKYVSGEAIKFSKLDPKNAKVIVCHLGNGASISASIGGRCVDTSMGLTPLEGLIMGTRSGDIDPSIIQYICNKENKSVDEVLNILNKKSGILGLSNGLSSDFRDIENAMNEGNHRAKVAMDAYIHVIVKYIGGYIAIMNGVDAICFTAGVGENDKYTRKVICDNFTYIGLKLDDKLNDIRGEFREISASDSKVKVLLLPTNEELAIARETLRLM